MRLSGSQTRTTKGLQATRFSPPKAPQTAIDRVRLVDRICGSEPRLVLICAPAGFGKTTLMQQLRLQYQARGIGAIWLQVDRNDDDLGRFLHSLTGAAQFALPQFLPTDIAYWHQQPTGSARGLGADLLDRISLSEDAIAFFLDDLERIADHDVCGFLQRLLTSLPRHPSAWSAPDTAAAYRRLAGRSAACRHHAEHERERRC
jgi:LuxR family transcriptional regulator, maltose regulon positive regulatory protein